MKDFDENLEAYDDFFAEAGHAFVLKPENLRIKVVTMSPTKKNPDSHMLNAHRHIDAPAVVIKNLMPLKDS